MSGMQHQAGSARAVWPGEPAAPSFRIAVVGHRHERLDPAATADLKAAAERVLASIGQATAGLDKSGAAPSLRLVTALADGADSIVADAALALGWPLDVVLPFSRADYLEDFAPEARGAFERQLAAAEAVFELPGQRSADESARAYERAGRIVLAQSDLLIAIWDKAPARGRGGTAQMVAEAVLQGVAVIQIDPADPANPVVLSDGHREHDLGQQTVETVARHDLSILPSLLGILAGAGRPGAPPPAPRGFGAVSQRRTPIALAYPMLLAAMGVRRPRRTDFSPPKETAALESVLGLCTGADSDRAFGQRLRAMLAPRFAQADATATHVAQLFRSGYVINFGSAALAVIVSLLGLALPSSLKPLLIVVEITLIATILLLTRAGNRAGWHRRWLENRQLAEQLRCLAVSSQLGELNLRARPGDQGSAVGGMVRATARELGMPSMRVDDAYLECCRSSLTALIEDQVGYLSADARRMHCLEHRLHRVGTVLFLATALICIGFLGFEIMLRMGVAPWLEELARPFVIAGTIASAGLPAIGAAIYGIRMQGDFAGVAKHSDALGRHLAMLRDMVAADPLDFDTLRRRERLVTDLLTRHLANWLQTYHARPLSLPG